MEIWVFGNPDLAKDFLPIKLLPKLREVYPQHDFIIQDPNEEWAMPEKLFIIDTVDGLDKVKTFNSLDEFQKTPRVTMHDFDLGTQLQFLKKLKKLPPFVIFGVPVGLSEKKVFEQLTDCLGKYLT
ncbi:MAG: hypothetical protein V1838_05200 [Patescibacteria group bacterium]